MIFDELLKFFVFEFIGLEQDRADDVFVESQQGFCTIARERSPDAILVIDGDEERFDGFGNFLICQDIATRAKKGKRRFVEVAIENIHGFASDVFVLDSRSRFEDSSFYIGVFLIIVDTEKLVLDIAIARFLDAIGGLNDLFVVGRFYSLSKRRIG